jgi:hypothetical protein
LSYLPTFVYLRCAVCSRSSSPIWIAGILIVATLIIGGNVPRNEADWRGYAVLVDEATAAFRTGHFEPPLLFRAYPSPHAEVWLRRLADLRLGSFARE